MSTKQARNRANKKYLQTDKGKQSRNRINKKYSQIFIGHLHRRLGQIRTRCNNSKNKAYKWYGARGIKCLFETNEFINHVISDLGYDTFEKLKGLQIDRIDNNGHYELGNIRFVTAKENTNNRRKQK